MKRDIVTDYYRPLLEQNHFLPIPCPEKFSPAGQCWAISPAVGGGCYWVYAKQDLFDIKIHDFYFNDDCCLDMNIPECISIQRYDSISGEELNPYRRLSAGDIQTIVGGKQRYRALIHKRIPIHAVGIEILPAYYEDFLKKQYPELYFDLPAAFQSVDQATDFPAMSKLLFEVENYRGDGAAAALFYEAKVTEAIALVVDAWKRQSQKRERNEAEKLLQAAVRVQRHAVHSGPENEPGGASAHQHRFYHGADCPDDRLYHIQPLCGAVQEEHGHSAGRVSEACQERSQGPGLKPPRRAEWKEHCARPDA